MIFAVPLLVGCSSDTTTDDDTDTTSPTGDTSTGIDTPTPTADTGKTTPTKPDDPVFATLHPTYPTLVIVNWDQPATGETYLEFRADKGPWMTSPAQTRDKGRVQDTILGVPYGAMVEYRIVSDTDPKLDVDGIFDTLRTIETGPLPKDLIEPLMLANDTTATDPDAPYLITSLNRDGDRRTGQWWVAILDRNGRYVWGEKTSVDWVSRHVSVSADGRALLVDRDTYWTLGNRGADSTIVRMTLDGTIEHTYDTPGLHHAFTPIGDNELAWAAKIQGSGFGETLEKVDLAGKQSTIWTCTKGVGLSSCGSNALWWQEGTDTLLFSLYSHDTVIDVNMATGTTVAVYGKITQAWDFDPPESQFWWNHGPTYTPDGTLLVSTRDEQNTADAETLVREYTLDADNETLDEIWNFGIGRGVYSTNMGEAYRLSNGNTLHVLGAGGRLIEVQPDKTVVWEADWNNDEPDCNVRPVSTTVCKHNGRTTAWNDLYQLLTPVLAD
ncbi:MAG: hypothetical protein KTR31_15130 [Myxococcales bacterium]|nr:hypothetical protein [Myxococcales bacterium]